MKRKILNSRTAIYLFLVLTTGFLTSCGEAYDKAKCYESVQSRYPKATIFQLPRDDFKYIVIDTCGNVMYVETLDNKTTKITSEIIVKNYR